MPDDKRRFLFTGGTSVLGPANARAQRANELGLPASLLVSKHRPDGCGDRDRASQADDAELRPQVCDLINEVVEHHGDLVSFGMTRREEASRSEKDANSLLRGLGAEAESIARRARPTQPAHTPQLADDDDIVILATDTIGCVLAAVITILISGRSPRLTLADPNIVAPLEVLSGAPAAPAGTVMIVQGMCASSPDGIEGSALALTTALSASARNLHGGSLVVEFSGGFKASIPLLLHVLEYIDSIQADLMAARITLWFRHEDTPDVWLRARLRRLQNTELNAHAAELERVVFHKTPQVDALFGFAWDDNYELTPVGLSAHKLLVQHGYPRY